MDEDEPANGPASRGHNDDEERLPKMEEEFNTKCHTRASEQVRWPNATNGTRTRRIQMPNFKSTVITILMIQTLLLLQLAQRIDSYQLANNLIANNLPPKFISSSSGSSAATNSEIVVRVKEGPASIGKLIYTLKGEDPDDDPLTFGVLGSMASDLLRIENVPGNQANVHLRKELDRETTESYQMVITLTDGKLGRGNWITKSMLIIVSTIVSIDEAH